MVTSVDRTVLFKREIAKNSNVDNLTATITENSDTYQYDLYADEIHKELSKANSKLSQLAQLAKKRSLYVDNTKIIEELTSDIKNNITVASNSIDTLEKNLENAKSKNQHTKQHYDNMINALRKQVCDMAKQFKELLHQRAQIMIQQESRRKLYSQNDSQNWTIGRKRFIIQQNLDYDQQVDIESGDVVSSGVSKSLLANAKAEALANVQRAIGDLTQIFQKVTTYVAQQDEMIKRIDADTETSLDNVKSVHDELYRYYTRISSKRKLLLKLFLLTIIFIIFYIFFLF